MNPLHFSNPHAYHTRIQHKLDWLLGFSGRVPITITGGLSDSQTNYQLKLSVPYSSGMKTTNFDDVRFTQADGKTLVDAWLESKTDGVSADVWVEFPTTPANTIDQTYYMYYGNSGAASDWDGSATFLQYHGASASTFLDSSIIPPASGFIYHSNMKCTGWATSGLMYVDYQNQFVLQTYPPTTKRSVGSWNGGSNTEQSETPDYSDGSYHDIKMIYTGSVLTGFIDDNQIGTTVGSNFPTNNLGLNMEIKDGTGDQKWSFARKYAANPPTYAFGTSERYEE